MKAVMQVTQQSNSHIDNIIVQKIQEINGAKHFMALIYCLYIILATMRIAAKYFSYQGLKNPAPKLRNQPFFP